MNQVMSQLSGFNGQIKSKDDVTVQYQLVADRADRADPAERAAGQSEVRRRRRADAAAATDGKYRAHASQHEEVVIHYRAERFGETLRPFFRWNACRRRICNWGDLWVRSNRTLVILGSVVLVVIVLAGWGLKAMLARPKTPQEMVEEYARQAQAQAAQVQAQMQSQMMGVRPNFTSLNNSTASNKAAAAKPHSPARLHH